MMLDTLIVGELKTNCYILSIDKKCLIIDPGAGENHIIKKIEDEGLEVVGILLTHNHFDHVGAVKTLEEMYRIKAYDYNTLFEQKHFLNPFKFQVIYTSGHTSDSITLYFYEYGLMFTGDFLFKDDVGRTDLETGSLQEMLESLKKIKEYNDDIKIYPGHGESTSLGYEKAHNKYLNQIN